MTNQLLHKERKISRLTDYGGVCDGCGASVSYPEIIGVEVFKNEVLQIVFPFDEFVCPNCFGKLTFIKVWQSLDVTKELSKT